MLPRRTFLQLLPLAALSIPDDLEMRDLRVPGTFSKRFTLFVPKPPSGPGAGATKLLVLLHGLGETGEERAGAYAWIERYGLGTAYARLRRPPVVRTSTREDVTAARLAEINAQLAAKPFCGLAIACPYIPNVHAKSTKSGTGAPPSLDDVTRWIVETVVPHANAEVGRLRPPTLNAEVGRLRPPPADAAPASVEIDGCSLGGFLALEVFLRRPDAFGACGGVQSAIGEASATRYARRFADVMTRVGKRDLYLATSTQDPFRAGNEALSRELRKLSVPHTLRVLPGPHDQPWLREAGTLDMLLWHDQRSSP